jgi:Ni2+-binding GTPase involved in maturation of urease and hydrogenase
MNTPQSRPWVVVVGGFLGAGKTTLLLAAARELKQRGMRSAVIMDDQGDALVDTQSASMQDIPHGEVTGGCFCCRFSELVDVLDDLRAFAPDVIFAEPVGSCTDISATTLQPLHEYSGQYRLAPFTVLVDPQRARELLRPDADPDLSFLFTKQLQEADIVCFTKSDIAPDCPELSEVTHCSIRQLSARTGQGVSAWVDEVLSGALSAGSRILDIDYQQYAQAEAALAWLNLEAEFECAQPVSPAALLGPFFDRVDTGLTAAGIRIVHMKAILTAPTGYVKAAICANGEEPATEGNLDASPAFRHSLLVNLRAVGAAAQIREIVEHALAQTQQNASLRRQHLNCFHPAAPQPERRISKILTAATSAAQSPA